MADYELHCFAQSGNAYKAALMLALGGADWEPVWVDFFHGGAKAPDYLALNEMGEVPTLVHGPTVLAQSGVILDYLAGTLGRFGPRTEDERREILRWTLWDNHKLTSPIATARFMLNFVAPEKRNPAVIEFLLARARTAMQVLERRLARQEWIAGRELTTADLSCVGYLYFTDEFGADMAAFPNIARWRDAIAAEPGWAHPYDLMPGHPLPA
jgi:glutathione S-transferase